MILHRKICMWLKAKGTPFLPDQFSIDNDSRAIARWDAVLGAPPTPADLAPFDPLLEDLAHQIRLRRDRLLAATDWAMLPDAPVIKDAWVFYRQQLRDVPKQPYFPQRVTWPDQPS